MTTSPAPPQPCCADFAKALEKGTDCEGWQPLFNYLDVETPGTVEVGCRLPPINFCPWCGARAG